MISPYEMALIYWTFLKAASVFEVEQMIKNLSPTSHGTDYWHEVWRHLNARRQRKGMLH